jgi:hypothetical protein
MVLSGTQSEDDLVHSLTSCPEHVATMNGEGIETNARINVSRLVWKYYEFHVILFLSSFI